MGQRDRAPGDPELGQRRLPVPGEIRLRAVGGARDQQDRASRSRGEAALAAQRGIEVARRDAQRRAGAVGPGIGGWLGGARGGAGARRPPPVSRGPSSPPLVLAVLAVATLRGPRPVLLALFVLLALAGLTPRYRGLGPTGRAARRHVARERRLRGDLRRRGGV